MDSQEVQRVGKGQKEETYKYLGVLIGEDLTFDEHVNRVRGKLVSAAFMLTKANHFCPSIHDFRCTGQYLRVI